MHVNFYANLRPLAGGKVVEVDISPLPAPARDVLEAATRNHPELAEALWSSPGVLKEHIKVFINGRESVHLPQAMETPVQEEDTLDVFPPLGGGSS